MGRLTAPQVTKSTGSSRFTVYSKAKRLFYNLQSAIFCVTAFEIFRLLGAGIREVEQGQETLRAGENQLWAKTDRGLKKKFVPTSLAQIWHK